VVVVTVVGVEVDDVTVVIEEVKLDVLVEAMFVVFVVVDFMLARTLATDTSQKNRFGRKQKPSFQSIEEKNESRSVVDRQFSG